MNGDNITIESLNVGNTLINSEWFEDVLTEVVFLIVNIQKHKQVFYLF